MSKATRETLWTLIYIIAGIITGWLTWRIAGKILFRSSPKLLPFLILGFAGALIYASVRLRGLGYALIMVILFFFLQLALTPPLRTEAVIRAGIWAGPVGLSFIFSGYIFKSLSRLMLGKFILMAILVGLAQALVAAVFRIRANEAITRSLLLWQIVLGGILGGFLGLFIELFELIPLTKSKEKENALPPI